MLVAQEPSYLHYGASDGLPGNVVYAGLQSQSGLLWFGTDKGLACYDGARFHTFGMQDGLPDPEVLNLMEDRSGNLWISCFQKKPSCRRNGRFFNEKNDSILNLLQFTVGIADFAEIGDTIWITGIEDVLYRIDKRGLHRLELPEYSAARFAQLEQRTFLFGTRHILEYGKDGSFKEVFAFNVDLRDHQRYLGFSISGNRVMASWSDRIVLLAFKNGRFEKLDERLGVAGRVFTGSDGSFWVCSPSLGALRFDSTATSLEDPQLFLKGYSVISTFEDHQRTRWFGTDGQGLFALPANAPLVYTRLPEDHKPNITALFAAPENRMYAGDLKGDVTVYQKQGTERSFHLRNKNNTLNKCRQIEVLPDGSSWYATDAGIMYYDQGRLRMLDRELASAKALLYSAGKLWVATFARCAYIDLKTLETRIIQARRFTCLANDDEGNVWAGSIDGLYSLRDSFSYNWGNTFPEVNNRISAALNAGNAQLWIATPELGLLLLTVHDGKVQKVEVVNQKLTKPIHNIVSMFKGPDGTLWLATNRGVFGLTPGWEVRHYDHNDGLPSNDVNVVSVVGDTLWVGTVEGLARLKISRESSDSDFKTLVASLHFQSGGKSVVQVLLDVPSDEAHLLPPDARLISLDLAALDFRSTGSLRYECTLSQPLAPLSDLTFERFWGWVINGFKPVQQTRTIEANSFNFGIQLAPGRYVMDVTAINNRGARSRYPARVALTMPARWSETLWFLMFVWLVVGFLVYRLFRTIAANANLRIAVSDLQLQALQAQINPHFIGNAINSIQQFFYPPNPSRASEYVSLLTRLLRRTLEFSEHKFIRFADEIAYDVDYLTMNQLRFGDRLSWEISGAESVPPDTLFPSMMLQPLLENALTYGTSPDNQTVIRLAFEINGQDLTCTLTDNGIGINAMRRSMQDKDRISKGLLMLYKKVETFNKLYATGMKLSVDDLGEISGGNQQGTRVMLGYNPGSVDSNKGWNVLSFFTPKQPSST